jgi:ketosteroid isomerase-like protein
MTYRLAILPALLASALLSAATPALAQDAPLSLEQRVARIEAEAEIRKVLVQYGAYIDGKDFAAYAGLFAPDGEWIGGFGRFTGPAAIEKMLVDNLGAPEPGFVNKANFHMMTNPIITVSGDLAEVTSKYMFWVRSPEDRPVPTLAGRYVDQFVRRDGQWKILRRSTWGEIPFRDPNAPLAAAPPALQAATADSRIRRLEDEQAIQRLIVDYAARLDARDYDGYAALFARDGVWQNGATVRRGRDEIRQLLVGLFGETPEGWVNRESYHLVSNPQVKVEGDRATARSRHLLLMRGEDGSPVPELTGLYEDEFIREDGAWKILKRVDHPIMPTPDEWRAEMARRQAR